MKKSDLIKAVKSMAFMVLAVVVALGIDKGFSLSDKIASTVKRG